MMNNSHALMKRTCDSIFAKVPRDKFRPSSSQRAATSFCVSPTESRNLRSNGPTTLARMHESFAFLFGILLDQQPAAPHPIAVVV